MKICFVCIFLSDQWGGSEELGSHAARVALSRGDDVLISVAEAKGLHPKFLELQNLGAMIILRYDRLKGGFSQKASKIKRMIKGHSKTPNHYLKFLEQIERFDPDLICIGQGGAFNILESKEVLFILDHWKKPINLISTSNWEHFVYT